MLNPYRFHDQPQQLMGYADASTKIPSVAWELTDLGPETNAKKRELEHLWAKAPELAFLYSRDVIKKPWPPGEAAIAGNATFAFRYARYVIKKPWPPGEAAIAGSADAAFEYALDVIGKPWPPGEAAIASSDYAKEYQDFKERRSR